MKWAALTKVMTRLGLFIVRFLQRQKYVIWSVANGMRPMNVVEKPIVAIEGSHRSTGDGVHLVARHCRKGTHLAPHMHRESQLAYAPTATMPVTTTTGR